jgi:hypothetical protein
MFNPHPASTTTSARSNPSRRKWFIDLQIRTASSDNTLATTTTAAVAANNNLLLAPVGFSKDGVKDIITQEDDDRLLARRSWDIALQPIKQLPMNMILAWMAGNSFSLMSIMIVVMLFMKPIQVHSFSLFSLFFPFL